MTVRLRYELVGTGWARCTVAVDGAHAELTASYLSDALDDLCRAVVEVLAGAAESTASFDEEPGEYRWRLSRVGGQRVRVRIVELDEPWGHRPDETGRVVLDADCELRSLAAALVAALEDVLAEHGDAGYRARWAEHDFPHARLAELRRLLPVADASSPPLDL